MLRLKPLLVYAGLVATPLATACFWDQDTLSNEAKAMPDVLLVATGRFDRNPPLYYQMRIDRETVEVKKHPERLDLYDDISVAYCRLGNDDTAIAWIKLKAAQMGDMSKARTVNGKRDAFSEAAYRYYANAGTFWIVRWMRHGANLSDTKPLQTSLNLIKRAIEINPDAHFGREVVQLRLTEWLLTGHSKSLSDYLGGGLENDQVSKEDALKNLNGLIGLVVLGALWESPDAFDAMAGLIERKYHNINRLGYFVYQRKKELESRGRKMLGDTSYNDDPAFHDKEKIESEYDRLRNDADRWQAERTDFMVARLKAGRHPDTDRLFWDGYVPRPLPHIEYSYFEELDPLILLLAAFICCCSSPFIVLSVWLVKRYRRRRSSS